MARTATQTASNPYTTMVECPKCCGAGNFRVWAHIANGDCFLCGSAKSITKAQAGRWLASQVSSAPRTTNRTQAPPQDNLKRKVVDVQGLGSTRFVRYEDGDIRVDLDGLTTRNEYGERETGGLWLVIRVQGGQVVHARDEDGDRLRCYGLACAPQLERHVFSCLQKALKR